VSRWPVFATGGGVRRWGRAIWARQISTSLIARRLASGATWGIAGGLASRAVTLLGSVVAARLLGQTRFGAVGVVQSTAAMFQVFGAYALGLTATKYVAQYKDEQPKRAGRALTLGFFGAVIVGLLTAATMLIGAGWLSNSVLSPELKGPLRIASALLFLGAVQGVQNGALIGFEAFKRLATLNVISAISGSLILVAGVVLGGVEGAIWGLAGGMAVTVVVGHHLVRIEGIAHRVRIEVDGMLSETRILWTFSLPAVLSGLLVAPVAWGCNALLVNQPNGYSEMGVLNAANQWYAALLFLPGVIGQATLPILADRWASSRRNEQVSVLSMAVAANAVVAVPLAVVLSIAGRWIMALYGAEYTQHWPVLTITIWTAAITAIEAPLAQALVAGGRMWLACTVNLVWGALTLALTFMFVSYGAVGVASARAGAYLIHGVLVLLCAHRMVTPPERLHEQTGPIA
jgi:O-antigen/teichoic acid export membrane protein